MSKFPGNNLGSVNKNKFAPPRNMHNPVIKNEKPSVISPVNSLIKSRNVRSLKHSLTTEELKEMKKIKDVVIASKEKLIKNDHRSPNGRDKDSKLSKIQPRQKISQKNTKQVNIFKLPELEEESSSTFNEKNYFMEDTNNFPIGGVIEEMKNIFQSNCVNTKYFLNSEVLNFQENSRMKFEKNMKINLFADEIEMMVFKLQKMNKEIKEVTKSKKEDSEFTKEDEDRMCKLLKMSSERRLNIYNDLFINLKSVFDEIILISQFANSKNISDIFQNEIIKDEDYFGKQISSDKDISDDSSENGDVNDVYVDIKSLGKIKYNKKISENIIYYHSNEENYYSDDDLDNNIDEGISKKRIFIPGSNIKSVKIKEKEENLIPLDQQVTTKDLLLYTKGNENVAHPSIRTNKKFYTESPYNSSTSKTKSKGRNLRPTLTTFSK